MAFPHNLGIIMGLYLEYMGSPWNLIVESNGNVMGFTYQYGSIDTGWLSRRNPIELYGNHGV